MRGGKGRENTRVSPDFTLENRICGDTVTAGMWGRKKLISFFLLLRESDVSRVWSGRRALFIRL